jgi:hypothetical protein
MNVLHASAKSAGSPPDCAKVTTQGEPGGQGRGRGVVELLFTVLSPGDDGQRETADKTSATEESTEDGACVADKHIPLLHRVFSLNHHHSHP